MNYRRARIHSVTDEGVFYGTPDGGRVLIRWKDLERAYEKTLAQYRQRLTDVEDTWERLLCFQAAFKERPDRRPK